MRNRNVIPRVIGLLSHGSIGRNPTYTINDFYAQYPQFFEPEDPVNPSAVPTPLVPMEIMQAYIDLANDSISYSLYGNSLWKICMGLFIAHFLTLYLQTSDDPLSGGTTGLISSKSVDSVSVSYDNSAITSDMKGFGMFKATSYGEQLVTFAKMLSVGGLYVR